MNSRCWWFPCSPRGPGCVGPGSACPRSPRRARRGARFPLPDDPHGKPGAIPAAALPPGLVEHSDDTGLPSGLECVALAPDDHPAEVLSHVHLVLGQASRVYIDRREALMRLVSARPGGSLTGLIAIWSTTRAFRIGQVPRALEGGRAGGARPSRKRRSGGKFRSQAGPCAVGANPGIGEPPRGRHNRPHPGLSQPVRIEGRFVPATRSPLTAQKKTGPSPSGPSHLLESLQPRHAPTASRSNRVTLQPRQRLGQQNETTPLRRQQTPQRGW